MAIEYFPCYHSYLARLAKLSDQEVGRLFRALLQYSATGERPELTGRESVAFDFIQYDIDQARENFETRCKKQRENIQKRWDTNDTTEYDGINGIPNDTNDTKAKAKAINNNPPISPNGDMPPKKGEAQKRFAPPTVEEVSAYCLSRSNGVDPGRFVDYYTSNGWKVGKNPMKDWKAAVRTWEKGEKEHGTSQGDSSTAQRLGIYL